MDSNNAPQTYSSSKHKRAISEDGQLDSMSEETKSSQGGDLPGNNDETFDEDYRIIADKCRPITSMIPSCKKEATRKYLFDVCAGLSGQETLNQFPCVYEPSSHRFFVWLGDLDFSLFSKSSFMNLCNFSEGLGASAITFLIYHQHRQKSQYRKMFGVIDAVRLGTDAVKDIIGAADRQAAKSVTAQTLFYELQL